MNVTIEGFDRRTEFLVSQKELNGVDASKIRKIFAAKDDEEFFDCWPINGQTKRTVEALLGEKLNDDLDWFLTRYAEPSVDT
jgi:hypothetical protein